MTNRGLTRQSTGPARKAAQVGDFGRYINKYKIKKEIDMKINTLRLLIILISMFALTAEAATISYDGSALPNSTWNYVSNGSETHSTFVSGGSLRMIDSTLLRGNSLGYIKPFSFDSSEIIDIEFRARVFSGESAIDLTTNDTYGAPFSIWMYDGLVRADMSIGPDSVTSLGPNLITSRPYTEEEIQEFERYSEETGIPLSRLIGDGNKYTSERNFLLNQTVTGTEWHTYNFSLTPLDISWYVDGLIVGQVNRSEMIKNITSTDRRINMMISSATADVELDYLFVNTSSVPIPAALWLLISGLLPLAGIHQRKRTAKI